MFRIGVFFEDAREDRYVRLTIFQFRTRPSRCISSIRFIGELESIRKEREKLDFSINTSCSNIDRRRKLNGTLTMSMEHHDFGWIVLLFSTKQKK